MNTTSRNLLPLLLLALSELWLNAASPSTAFTYQGRLFDGGAPATGLYDLQFTCYEAAAGTNALGGFNTNALPVTNGLFTIALDFGAVFDGSPRWLEISERASGTSSFVTLSPRQLLATAPYATYAANAGTAAALSGSVTLAQLPAGVVTNNEASVTLNGSFSGDGSGLTNVPGGSSPQLVGTASVSATANNTYIATNDAQSVGLTLPANATVGQVVRVVGLGGGGWSVMTANGQVFNGVQAGAVWTPRDSNRGWQSVASSADSAKLVAADYFGQIYTSTDSGVTWTPRDSNRKWFSVASSADGTRLVAVVLDGQIYTSSDSGVTWTPRDDNRSWWSVASSAAGSKLVAADFPGQIYTSSDSGVTWTPRDTNRSWCSVASSADGTKLVAAAFQGQIYTSSDSGVTWTPRDSNREWGSVASSADGNKLVAAEERGRIYTSSDSGVTWTPRDDNRNWCSVASSADGTRLVAVVTSGQIYTSSDSGVTWTPRDGNRNWFSVASSADGTRLVAVVMDGQIYTSSDTVMGGMQGDSAEFMYVGNGVWQPTVTHPSGADLTVSGSVSAANGIYTDSADQNTGRLNPGLVLGGTGSGEGISSQRQSGANQYGLDFYTGTQIRMSIGRWGNVGIGTTTPTNLLQVANAYCDGNTWSPASDRNLKAGFTPVDPAEVLAKVAALPVTRWHYTNDTATPHLGPVAQDFHAAFGLGADDKHIADVDEGGVALAAIQGLNQKLEETRADNAALRADNADLRARLEKLERLLRPSK